MILNYLSSYRRCQSFSNNTRYQQATPTQLQHCWCCITVALLRQPNTDANKTSITNTVESPFYKGQTFCSWREVSCETVDASIGKTRLINIFNLFIKLQCMKLNYIYILFLTNKKIISNTNLFRYLQVK